MAPIKGSTSGGISVGGNPYNEPPPQPYLRADIGLYPQQVFDNPRARPFELGAGYLLEIASPTIPRHGSWIGGSWLFWHNAKENFRALTHLSAEVLTQGGLWGGGSTLGVGIEWVSFANGGDVGAGGGGVGLAVMRGEAAIGFDLSTHVRVFSWGPQWALTLGATFRLPATAGILLVPLK